MKVEDAATANTGVWVTFILVTALYIGVAVTTVLVLRSMSRRFRRQDATTADIGPYSPREPVAVGARVGGDVGGDEAADE
jgi:cytochrome d ubiquinol oxidase subunit I